MRKISVFFLLFVILCSAGFSQGKEIVILHTNDTHSQIKPFVSKEFGNVGGVLRRFELIKQVKAENPATLILDAGDFSQGTPYFNFFKGFAEIELMNRMGYEVVTLGNHEFDNGVEALAKRLKKAKFKVVCANYTFKNKALAKLVKPYTILHKNGLKIGIFGLTTKLEGLTSADVLKQITYHDASTIAKEVTAKLKNEEKCDLIICLSHLGLTIEEATQADCDVHVAENTGDIDIIIGGHTHTFLQEPKIVNNVLIVQLGKQGGNIGKFKINIEK